tara:strand:- start:840 stop:974 length:135 start_codon:yes stop_codon:yes gene_type:complete
MDLKDLKEKILQFIDDIAKSLGVELRVLVLIAFFLGFFLGQFLG